MAQYVRVIKVGTGLYARIPNGLARQAGVQKRDYLMVTHTTTGGLVYVRVAPVQHAPQPRAGR